MRLLKQRFLLFFYIIIPISISQHQIKCSSPTESTTARAEEPSISVAENPNAIKDFIKEEVKRIIQNLSPQDRSAIAQSMQSEISLVGSLNVLKRLGQASLDAEKEERDFLAKNVDVAIPITRQRSQDIQRAREIAAAHAASALELDICTDLVPLDMVTRQFEIIQGKQYEASQKPLVSRITSVGAITRVNVINVMPPSLTGHYLPVTLSSITSSGKSLAKERYWPEIGDQIIAIGPTIETDIKRGFTQTLVAEYSRYVGLETGSSYSVEQTVDLPKVGAKLKLIQRFQGPGYVGISGKSWLGVAIQNDNGEWDEELFEGGSIFQDKWHKSSPIAHYENGMRLGEYEVDYCFYHGYSIPTNALPRSLLSRKTIWAGMSSAGLALLGAGAYKAK